MTKVLLQVRAGLGDAVQQTILIKHLKHYHPDWTIGVECPVGMQGVFYPTADYVYPRVHPFYWRKEYDQTIKAKWNHSTQQSLTRLYPDIPATKVTESILAEFALDPIPELYTYTITPNAQAHEKAETFAKESGNPFALIHYQGVSSPEKKNLMHDEAFVLVQWCNWLGVTPVIWDWEFRSERSKVVKDCLFINPITAPDLFDAGVITALIQRAEVVYGIDSGIGHLAGATKTPTAIFWTYHHPLYCYDIADNVTHICQNDINNLTDESGKTFFKQNYNVLYWEDLSDYFWHLCDIADGKIESEMIDMIGGLPHDVDSSK